MSFELLLTIGVLCAVFIALIMDLLSGEAVVLRTVNLVTAPLICPM